MERGDSDRQKEKDHGKVEETGFLCFQLLIIASSKEKDG